MKRDYLLRDDKFNQTDGHISVVAKMLGVGVFVLLIIGIAALILWSPDAPSEQITTTLDAKEWSH